MKIGIDSMGGDFAPEAVVTGSILAYNKLPSDVKLVLIGDEEKAKKIIAKEGFNASNFEFVNAPDVIGMDEHPAKAFSKKKKSSITVGFDLLGKGLIDGFASAGNTGAMLAGSMFIIKQISGIIRPCIAAAIPQLNGSVAILLDVGLNPDCKPDVLYQYAKIGSIYAKDVYGIENPRVGILNIGSEKEKGNLLTKATYELMLDTTEFNFCGNAEGTDLFSNDNVDVFVCDGFVGNVVLKEAEAFYSLTKKLKIENKFFERFNFENFGGTPILGINSNVIIGHGVSNSKAIKNMVLHSKEVIEASLPSKFKEAFK